ncbi:histidine kinase [Actinomyces sp. 2119]|uniref:histidine kinase n=1 Tax=Actinomyces lilanjuaniae TaxID=2321394 RepID=A0ABM6Z755_9ACTO|nr:MULTISPECIES: PAS domain-containing sensor histidine kinase [Actinomyces]AYD90930.1 histidine kinase [Actinomyces lilanjuaniae]RJF41582.1 histidine kinase [Actinomyces sp. 2119]
MPIFLPAALRGIADLSDADLDWIHQLVADWQVVADLSTCDLVLWVRTRTGPFVAVGHTRPSGGATVHLEDVIGRRMPASREVMAEQALTSGEVQVATEPYWTGTAAVQEEYVPVVRAGTPVAVVTREMSVGVIRGGRIVDREMERLADLLCQMVAEGTFPLTGAGTTIRHGTPRVADGVVHLGEDGTVLYASPNGRSCFYRLGIKGDLGGVLLAEAVTSIIPARTQVDETLAVVLMGRQAWLTEVEAGGVFLSLRSIPLTLQGRRAGAVLLVRDITEVRRREQALLSKDATIREVHHRVKNNLQTVSALLRMQARRASNEETRHALSEAERRVTTIATVHDALSHSADEHLELDEILSSILRMAAAVASPTSRVETRVQGSFGSVGASAAQALATVLAELVTNAVEHGLEGGDGEVCVHAERDGDTLEVHVTDNGAGVRPGTLMTGLGTRIVTTLVRGELRGSIEWLPAAGGRGTDVLVRARLSGA